MTLASRPVPSSRHNPCPVCEGINGACRTLADDTVFCHGLADVRKGEKVNSYICVKPANGHTATFKPDNTSQWTEERKREWEAQKVARQQRAEQEELVRRSRALSAVNRHQLYSQLLDQLRLDDTTLADLQQRGFTQTEIDICGFKSVAKWQRLASPIDPRLPGISKDGQSLLTSGDGYVCPLYDINGHIVALQLRLHNPSDDNRYRWLSSSGQTLALYPEGENPLTVLRPTGKPEGIALVEGTGAKPFLVAQRLNLLVLGAAGGQWSSSPQILKQWLEQLHQEVGGEKVVTLYPDAGDVRNKDVIRRWRKVTNLLVNLGWQVKFAWWAQVSKDFPDIDELQPEQFDNIRYLSIAEFKALCIKWGGLEKEKTSDVLPIDYEERVRLAQKRLHTLSYPADIVCDPTKKYLPDLVGRIPTKGIVGIVSPKGSGKSHQIKRIKDYCCGYWSDKIIHPVTPELPPEQLELFGKTKAKQQEEKAPEPQRERVFNKGLGMRFLSINARIALGRGQAIQWEFTWIEDADLEASTEFGGAKLRTVTILEQMDQIGLCWDSLSKIFQRDWSNTLVVIDEIELGLNHVSTSSTCQNKRSAILHTLESKLRECVDNGGLVLCADADLTDISLDYLTAIAPGHPPFIVSHDFKGDPWEVNFYIGKRDVVLSEIENWLSDKDCKPIAVAIDNQRECESLAMFLTKKYPWLAQEVGGLIRIDSKVTQTDFGKDFVKRTNESIQKNQPKVLLYTPSLGVGCSIDVKYFAHVFGLFFGNLEPSQARQMLARVRESVPRTVWAKDRANNSENEASSYLPEEIKRRMFDYHSTTTTLIDLAVSLAKERTENPQCDQDLLPNLVTVLQEMMGKDGTWNNPHIDLYCRQVARRNFSLSQLAVQLREELLSEGHLIKDDFGEGETSAGDGVRAGKDEINLRDATATANAKDISYEQAQELKSKSTRTDEEQYQANKAFLKHDLPGVELTPEFVLKAKYKDAGRWLAQAKLFWHIYNIEALKDKDKREWRHKLTQFAKGVAYLPDIKTDTPKVDAIIKSGVLNWVKPDDLEGEYSNESPEGQAFVKNAYYHRKLIKTALNITVQTDSEPIKLANRILDRIGLGLVYTRRDKQGDRTRYYKLDEELATDRDRQAVWQALNQRWQERCSAIAESQSQPRKNLVQNENNFLYKNESSGQENKPDESTQNDVVDHTTETFTPSAQEVKQSEVEEQEQLLGVIHMLSVCEDREMLDDLRSIYPANLLKVASRQLPIEQYNRIRQWVVAS